MEALTERERKIVQLMGEGYSDVSIALQFHISAEKLKSFIDGIKQKTGLSTRPELEQLGRSEDL